MDSIIQRERKCYICHTRLAIHKHHIFYGRGNRDKSEKHGFTAYLCASHHNMGDNCVHRNRSMDLFLKRTCQREFEKTHTRNEFMAIIGKNYSEEI